MRWIRKHKLISALLAILLALIIIFVTSIFMDKEQNGVTGAVNKGMSYISSGLSSAARGVKKVFSFHTLQQQIDDLEEENAALQRELAEAKLQKAQLESLEELSQLLNYDYTSQKFNVVTADLTSMDGSNWTNVFTINRGTESGIAVGCAVINGVGLVGKVTEAGKGWAKVVSVIDDGNKVSFKVARDRKQLGVVSGNTQGEISGYMLDSESTVSEGDVIITSGLGTYPQGLEIGTVMSVTYNSNTLLKEITVEPVVNFRSIEKVAVII